MDSKEKVEVIFPVHVSLCFMPAIIWQINSWQTALSQCHNVVTMDGIIYESLHCSNFYKGVYNSACMKAN